MRALSRTAAIVAAAAGIASGCSHRADPTGLSPGESALVDLYVQLAVLERQHTERPDSVAAVLDSLWAVHDSLGLAATLRGLEAAPARWEAVFTAIDARLQALQAEAGRSTPHASAPDGAAIPVPRDSLAASH